MTKIVKTVTNWIPMKDAWEQFIAAHPELGIKFSQNTFNNFSRAYVDELLTSGAVRKPYKTAPAIADVNTFDDACFEIITRVRTEVA